MITVTLPWPDERLKPNARVHRMAKASAAKRARQEAALLAEWEGSLMQSGRYEMRVYVYPPNKQRRDLDNVLASLKPSLDGIFDRIGLDDCQVERITIERCYVQMPGRIEIELEEWQQ